MKYLVTGGAGFIGSHLSEALLEQRHRVRIIDDLSTGRMENIEHLKSDPSFKCVIDSITNEAVLAELVRESDVIFHLAAAVGVMLIVQSPVHTIETNIHGTETLLKLAATHKKKVILASSSEVYGKGVRTPFHEDDDMVFGPTTKARWLYGCSKAIDEFLALSYHKEQGLPMVIVRLFNIVGPRQVGRYGMVLPRFVKQALAGGPITVFGDGRQVRSFLYVGELVPTLISLASTEEAVGKVFNLGSARGIAIEELARKVQALVNPDAEITHVPYERAYEKGFEDVRTRVPDISKIQKLIGFQPTLGIDEIIDRLLEAASEEDKAG